MLAGNLLICAPSLLVKCTILTNTAHDANQLTNFEVHNISIHLIDLFNGFTKAACFISSNLAQTAIQIKSKNPFFS
jgi:hypothetical protein